MCLFSNISSLDKVRFQCEFQLDPTGEIIRYSGPKFFRLFFFVLSTKQPLAQTSVSADFRYRPDIKSLEMSLRQNNRVQSALLWFELRLRRSENQPPTHVRLKRPFNRERHNKENQQFPRKETFTRRCHPPKIPDFFA